MIAGGSSIAVAAPSGARTQEIFVQVTEKVVGYFVYPWVYRIGLPTEAATWVYYAIRFGENLFLAVLASMLTATLVLLVTR